MQLDPAARRRAIEKALLEYHRSPGKHALALRQPSLLYAGMKDVLHLAAGRAPERSAAHAAVSAQVQQAARLFIRSALLHPDADHYGLLGLERDADTVAIKDRYRLMMRLMHPDFARADAAWPADAATRVNRAYDVLSSPLSRRQYDEANAPRLPSPAPAERSASTTKRARRSIAVASSTPPKRQSSDGRRHLWRLSAVFGAAGSLALIVAGIATLQSDRESLVQRSKAVVSAPESKALAYAPARVTAMLTPAPRASAASAVVATSPSAASQPAGARPAAQVAAAPPASPGAAPAAPPVAEMASVTPAARPSVSIHWSTPASEPPPASTFTAAAMAPAPITRAAPYSGPTLADVHPMLSRLLQEIESGWGDRVMGLVDREARGAPAEQALLTHYNNLVGSARPLKISNVQFNAQPRDGRLIVTGHLTMQPPDGNAPSRDFAVQAEFASRDGAVVMTRLVRAD